MAKLPSFQFYPGDWLKDPDLSICSIFARGLLIDLLAHMWEANQRGCLVNASGNPWTEDQIFRAVGRGESREQVLGGLKELTENGVLKRHESGYLYSARMVRDDELREERRKAGALGGKQKAKQTSSKTLANNVANGVAKASSSSSSSSSSSDIEDPPIPPKGEEETKKSPFVAIEDLEIPQSLDTPEGRTAITDWLTYKRKRKSGYKDPGFVNRLLKEFAGESPGVLQAAVDFSSGRNYQGLVRPGGSNGTQSAEQRQLSELDKAIKRTEQEIRDAQGSGPPLLGLPERPVG